MSITGYQSLLLSQVMGTGALKLTSSFSNPSLLRKRMLMMSRVKTSSLANLKLLPVIPVVLLILVSVSANPVTIPGNDDIPLISEAKKPVYVPLGTAEEMPVFPGGDEALLKYVSNNVIYPQKAVENKTMGRVIIRFCVTPEGEVSMAEILKGVDPELDKEALRVVNSLPRFTPGKQDGKAVPVWHMIPITFTVK